MANPPELLVRAYFPGDMAVHALGVVDDKGIKKYLVARMIGKTVITGKQYDNRAQAIHSAMNMLLDAIGTLE